jgi:hypothetical protein
VIFTFLAVPFLLQALGPVAEVCYLAVGLAVLLGYLVVSLARRQWP